MTRIRIATLTSMTSAIGVMALLFTACAETAVGPESSSPTTGGSAQDTTEDTSTAKGGSSNASSKKGQGGSSQTSKTSSVKSEGGNSGATEDGQGGSSETDEGGSSPTTTGKGGASKGGTTSKATATKAAGGTSATGGSGPKATGGASTTKGGTTAKGGSSSTGGASSTSSSTCTAEEEKFSFFLASDAALQIESGSKDGFGGNLGGLTGADKICQKIAETSAPCHKGTVTWHAFLSTKEANARDRIGKGPWYDRRGRILAKNLTDLLQERPAGADEAIKRDFPNENGVPNHKPDGTEVDNHEILTGTGTDGKVYTQSASTGGIPGFNTSTSCGPKGEETWDMDRATCWGWTSNEPKGCPRVGHSWPREGSGIHWISCWNEGGCAPGGTLEDTGGLVNGVRKVGSAGGYGGFYCFAVTGE